MISIFLRIFLSSIVFTGLAFSLSLYFFSGEAWKREEWKHFLEDMDIEYNVLSKKLISMPNAEKASYIDNNAKSLFGHKLELLMLEDIIMTKAGAELSNPAVFKYISNYDEYPWYAIYRLADDNYLIKIIDDHPDQIELDKRDLLWLLKALIAAAASLLFGSYLLTRLVRAPVNKLVRSAEKFGAGNFSARADTNAVAPLNQLAESFNGMAGDIQHSFIEKEIMLAAIPHELQTPLARVRFLLELSKKERTEEELKSNIEQIDESISELEKAVFEVLRLIRFRERDKVRLTQFNLVELIRSEKNTYSKNQQDKVRLDIDPQFMVVANRELLNRVLHNVISNGLRYCHFICRVSARLDGDCFSITVEDDGPGIPIDRRVDVFAAFSRLDQGRNEETGGLGLGLALVKVIVEEYKGEVLVNDSELGGALIEVRWPACKNCSVKKLEIC